MGTESLREGLGQRVRFLRGGGGPPNPPGAAPNLAPSPAALAPRTPPPPQAHPRRAKFGEPGAGVGGAAAPPSGSQSGTCRRLARCSQRFVIISLAFLISKKPLAGFISSSAECSLGQGPGWATSSRVPSGLTPLLHRRAGAGSTGLG